MRVVGGDGLDVALPSGLLFPDALKILSLNALLGVASLPIHTEERLLSAVSTESLSLRLREVFRSILCA
jgi:hypothetical protein